MEDEGDFIRRIWRQRRGGNKVGITMGQHGPNLHLTNSFNIQTLSIKCHCPPSNAFGNMWAEQKHDLPIMCSFHVQRTRSSQY
jgi:hypothetical protein